MITRRNFIKLASATAIGSVTFAQKIGRLKVGLQTFCLRHLPLEEALETSAKLGISYVETFGWDSDGHLPFESAPERLEQIRQILEKNQLTLEAYGVIGFYDNEIRTRKIFDFARSMKIKVITADPHPSSYGLLEKLVDEMGIKIAIHPHGPGHEFYPGWKAVQQAIKNLHPNIGICMDVGHVTRNGESAVEGIRELGNRVYGVHLKDLDRRYNSVPLGKGIVDIYHVLRTLERIPYSDVVSIEFELPDGQDPMDGIQQSHDYVYEVLSE